MEYVNLDVRDVDALAREAHRHVIRAELHDIQMARMAWVEGKDVQAEFDRLNGALDRLEGPRPPKQYPKTWTEALGKKKG